MRISDWSSDVCSSDLSSWLPTGSPVDHQRVQMSPPKMVDFDGMCHLPHDRGDARIAPDDETAASEGIRRSEEHTSELQSLMRISYDVFCLKTKITNTTTTQQLRMTTDKNSNQVF